VRATVLDMQPIDPPIGGGRLRLLGLYHNLGGNIDCTYVGTYDWRGENYRDHQLTPTLREIDIPLSEAHHAAAAELASRASNKTVIDIAFSQQAHLSPDYLCAAREQIANSDVVIFSHPWVYPVVKDHLRPDHIIIYDSQNVEGYLRTQLLDHNNPVEAQLLRQVIQDENALGWAADSIIACSQEDLLRFHRIYGFPLERMRVVPNGVMAFRESLPNLTMRLTARRLLKLDANAFTAIFLGSAYAPNVQAGEFIIKDIAPAMPAVTFLIAGGVGSCLTSTLPNVRITGQIPEADKLLLLQASDIALNPMMSGSGTNIKMFDFMAMGLPVVSTSVGARGIHCGGKQALLVVPPTAESFFLAIDRLRHPEIRASLGRAARECVEEGYAWERISEQLGCFISARAQLAGQSKPFFSVVLTSTGAHDTLTNSVMRLQEQIERDFELVIIDQSAQPWPGANRSYGFPLTYYCTPICGVARARNTGAMLAQGQIIAFLDGSAQPEERWLLNARSFFANPNVFGLIGLPSHRTLSNTWHPIENTLVPELRFPQTNMLVRTSVFHYVGGCDIALRTQDSATKELRFHGTPDGRNLLEVGRELLADPHRASQIRIAHLSTAGLTCGIGEYTRELIDIYHDAGVSNLLLYATTPNEKPDLDSINAFTTDGWFLDNVNWVHSEIRPKALREMVQWGATHLIIQYHSGFYPPSLLLQFVTQSQSLGIKTSVVLHNLPNPPPSDLARIRELGVPLFSHNRTALDQCDPHARVFTHVPLGICAKPLIRETPLASRDWQRHSPRIVTTGFLRKHKGIVKLIRALPHVHKSYPQAELRIQCALYPSEDSELELKACTRAIQELGLHKSITVQTTFLEKSALLIELSQFDIAVLPYEQSSEGGSATAADCLCAGLPLIVSTAEIFDDLREVALTVDPEPVAIATAIISILRDSGLYGRYYEKAHIYARRNSLERVAGAFLVMDVHSAATSRSY
jgi:glycosyltransferase involved in cell wall biosynthesis